LTLLFISGGGARGFTSASKVDITQQEQARYSEDMLLVSEEPHLGKQTPWLGCCSLWSYQIQ
jgi:hypothetical protein